MKKFRQGLYIKQKRQDWDHKANHDAPSTIYFAVADREGDMHMPCDPNLVSSAFYTCIMRRT